MNIVFINIQVCIILKENNYILINDILNNEYHLLDIIESDIIGWKYRQIIIINKIIDIINNINCIECINNKLSYEQYIYDSIINKISITLSFLINKYLNFINNNSKLELIIKISKIIYDNLFKNVNNLDNITTNMVNIIKPYFHNINSEYITNKCNKILYKYFITDIEYFNDIDVEFDNKCNYCNNLQSIYDKWYKNNDIYTIFN